MGIALLALSDLFTPIQSLAHRWIAPRGRAPARSSAQRGHPVELPADLRYVQVRPSTGGARPSEDRTPVRPSNPSRPLRVVRVTEAGQPQAHGRVLLSGRMEDVCAELERLTALEAAQTHGVSRQLH